jgi:hypothetical protein
MWSDPAAPVSSRAEFHQLVGRRVVIVNPKKEGHGMKDIVVKVCGSDQEPVAVHLQPGATAREVLAAIGLDERMRLRPDPSKNAMLEGEDDVWSQIEDSQRVYAILLTYAC